LESFSNVALVSSSVRGLISDTWVQSAMGHVLFLNCWNEYAFARRWEELPPPCGTIDTVLFEWGR
jgi:hypothetical protein